MTSLSRSTSRYLGLEASQAKRAASKQYWGGGGRIRGGKKRGGTYGGCGAYAGGVLGPEPSTDAVLNMVSGH